MPIRFVHFNVTLAYDQDGGPLPPVCATSRGLAGAQTPMKLVFLIAQLTVRSSTAITNYPRLPCMHASDMRCCAWSAAWQVAAGLQGERGQAHAPNTASSSIGVLCLTSARHASL